MAYQWGRFVWWLGQNAAAIQAVTSVITVILTFVLARITAQYVRLTAQMSRSAEAQLLAQYQPSLEITLQATKWDGEVEFTLANRGQRSIQLVSINLFWPYPDDPMKTGRQGIGLGTRSILEPSNVAQFRSKVERELEGIASTFFNDLTIIVDCRDLSAPGNHSFSYSRNAGPQYATFFRTRTLADGKLDVHFLDDAVI